MKKFEKAEIEIEVLLRGDVITFSWGDDNTDIYAEEEDKITEDN